MAELNEKDITEGACQSDSPVQKKTSPDVENANSKPLESPQEESKLPENVDSNREPPNTTGSEVAGEGTDEIPGQNMDQAESLDKNEAGQNSVKDQSNLRDEPLEPEKTSTSTSDIEQVKMGEPGKAGNDSGGKLTAQEQEALKQKIRDNRENTPDTSRYKESVSGTGEFHSKEKAKFNSKNYENEIRTKGEAAYEDAKASGKSEAEAQYAKNKAEVYMRQKMDSSATHSDEARILKHAEAKANQAKETVAKEGGSEQQQNRAYNKAFGKTYAYDNKYDPSRLMQRADANGEKARSTLEQKFKLEDERNGKPTEKIQKAREEELARAYNDAFNQTYAEDRTDFSKQKVTQDDLNGRTVNQIKPGTKYFDIYDDQRKGESSVWHGEMVPDELSAVSGKPGESSKVYLGTESYASPNRNRAENSLPNMNTAQYREYVNVNATNDQGTNVFAIDSNSSAQLHQQKIKGSAFEKLNRSDPDLVGGGRQIALTTGGKYDGSVVTIDHNPTSEMALAKQDYMEALRNRGAKFDEHEIDQQSGKIQKVEGDSLKEGRADFVKEKDMLIQNWETLNGEAWPKYETDILNDEGHAIRKAGDNYDAHHIQPLSMGGRNTAENITPLHVNDHIGKDGIHGTSEYRNLSDTVEREQTTDT